MNVITVHYKRDNWDGIVTCQRNNVEDWVSKVLPGYRISHFDEYNENIVDNKFTYQFNRLELRMENPEDFVNELLQKRPCSTCSNTNQFRPIYTVSIKSILIEYDKKNYGYEHHTFKTVEIMYPETIRIMNMKGKIITTILNDPMFYYFANLN